MKSIITPSPSLAEVAGGLDYNGVYDVVCEAIGSPLMAMVADTDPHTFRHQIETGQLASGFLVQTGFDEGLCAESAAVAGSHDSGKTKEWIQKRIHSDEVFDTATRQLVREEHCNEGATMIAMALIHNVGASPDMRLRGERMAFVAQRHHSLAPEGYWNLSEELALRWGLNCLTRYADVMHAVWFDARAYVPRREGKMNAERAFGIVMGETGGQEVVIQGHKVDMRPLLATRLGLPEDYQPKS